MSHEKGSRFMISKKEFEKLNDNEKKGILRQKYK